MEVKFTKLTDARHAVAVVRDDGSTEREKLDSRSFLNDDFAHLAIEAELRLERGFWGSVAAGAGIAGLGLEGDQIGLEERLAGPESLLRVDAGPAEIQAALEALAPTLSSGTGAGTPRASSATARPIAATPYQGEMLISWPLDPGDRPDVDTPESSAPEYPAASVRDRRLNDAPERRRTTFGRRRTSTADDQRPAQVCAVDETL